jgi:hypothetical protein
LIAANRLSAVVILLPTELLQLSPVLWMSPLLLPSLDHSHYLAVNRVATDVTVLPDVSIVAI